MKRDMDLIRRLMLDIEKQPAGMHTPGTQLYRDGDDPTVVAEHLALLIDHQFLKGHVARSLGGLELGHVVVLSILWRGHEFLDAVRNDTVWKKTKDKVASVGGTASVEILTQVATGFLKQMLGLAT